MKHLRWWIALLIAVMLGVLATLPIYSEYCQADSAGHNHCASYNFLLVLWWQIAKLFDHDTINVVSTAVIALFTIALWRATKALGVAAAAQGRDFQASMKIAKRANRIARDALIASNRPWLHFEYKISNFHGSGTNFVVDIAVIIKNVGKSPAKHVVELIGWPEEAVDLGNTAKAIEDQFTPSPDEIKRRRRTPTLFPGDAPVTHAVRHVGTYDGSMITPIFCGVTYSGVGIKGPLYSATIINLQIRKVDESNPSDLRLQLVATSGNGIYTK